MLKKSESKRFNRQIKLLFWHLASVAWALKPHDYIKDLFKKYMKIKFTTHFEQKFTMH
jgi:hypothetical protein